MWEINYGKVFNKNPIKQGQANMFKYLTIAGLICNFIGSLLLIFDIRLSLKDKTTINEALDRDTKRKKRLETLSEDIFSKIICLIKGRKKLKWRVSPVDEVLYQDMIEKEHVNRLKWGFTLMLIGFLLQLISEMAIGGFDMYK